MSTNTRQVQQLIIPQTTSDGAGVRLMRSIATQTLDYLDPFLLFDHFGSMNAEDYIAGFPMHPHRGIETVTYMLAGEINHRDSIGNAGTIGPGDIQWMTAGRGILHEEMPKTRQGRMEGFQLWVNLPARDKMMAPRYRDVLMDQVPVVELDGGGTIRVVAGEVDGVRGPVRDVIVDPTYLDITLPVNTSFIYPTPSRHTVFAYVFEGQADFGQFANGAAANPTAPQLVVFGDGEQIQVQTQSQPVRFLLVMGQPLGEPIARYGPFVMNTWEEIQQTLREIRAGTFAK